MVVLLPLVQLMPLNIDIVGVVLEFTGSVGVADQCRNGRGDLRKRSLIYMNAWHTSVEKNRERQEKSAWMPLACNAFLIT